MRGRGFDVVPYAETLEACVVVAVMLNLCTKLKMDRMRRQGELSAPTRTSA